MLKKNIFLIMLMISTNVLGEVTQGGCDDCMTKIEGSPADEVKQFEPLAKIGASENIEELAGTICNYYLLAGADMAKKIKTVITNHIAKYEKVISPSKAQIIQFLNKNKNYMMCGEDKKTNYLVEAFGNEASINQLYNVLFFDLLVDDDTEEYIDVNAISYSTPDGKPETVLDFMYREIKKPLPKSSIEEIKGLIELFEEDLGAKRYQELIH